MGGACCLHDTGVQKLTVNMLCPFLTSPGEGRPQHNITCLDKTFPLGHFMLHFIMFLIRQMTTKASNEHKNSPNVTVHCHRVTVITCVC